MADCTVAVQCGKCRSSGTTQFQRKRQPSLHAEYVVAFSRRSEAPEVRCDLTDKQTDTTTNVTLAAHARRGLKTQNKESNNAVDDNVEETGGMRIIVRVRIYARKRLQASGCLSHRR